MSPLSSYNSCKKCPLCSVTTVIENVFIMNSYNRYKKFPLCRVTTIIKVSNV